MLFLVWTNSSVCSDSTNLRLALKQYVLQNHQHVQLLSITQISQKRRTQWATFCFKHKTQLARSRQITQIKIEKC